MRADAWRNRQAVLAAARALFVERGVDVPLEAVADRAGVSIATLYRNFADRHALLREVAMDGMATMRDAALEARRQLRQDDGGAWREFAAGVVALRAGVLMPMLMPVLSLLDTDHDTAFADVLRASIHAVHQLVAAAQEYRFVRADVSAVDVVMLLHTVSRPPPVLADESAAAFSERALAVVLAGLRPGADPLPGHPLPLDPPRGAGLTVAE